MNTGRWQRHGEWEAALKVLWDRAMPGSQQPLGYKMGLLAALVGREAIGGRGADLRWHISVQHRDRVPSWEEMVRAAHDLRPGVVFVIGVPPESWWLNLQSNVLHMWETADAGLVDEYRTNARGDRPT